MSCLSEERFPLLFHTATDLDENRVPATCDFQNLKHHFTAATTTTTLPKDGFHFWLTEPLLLPFYYFAQLKLLLT